MIINQTRLIKTTYIGINNNTNNEVYRSGVYSTKWPVHASAPKHALLLLLLSHYNTTNNPPPTPCRAQLPNELGH